MKTALPPGAGPLGVGPVAERIEGIDASGVPVVPGRAQTPRPMHFCRGDLKRDWTSGSRPTLFPAIPQAATLGARAAKPQCNKIEFGDEIVGEGDRYPLGALHMNIQGFKAVIHAHSL